MLTTLVCLHILTECGCKTIVRYQLFLSFCFQELARDASQATFRVVGRMPMLSLGKNTTSGVGWCLKYQKIANIETFITVFFFDWQSECKQIYCIQNFFCFLKDLLFCDEVNSLLPYTTGWGGGGGECKGEFLYPFEVIDGQ